MNYVSIIFLISFVLTMYNKYSYLSIYLSSGLSAVQYIVGSNVVCTTKVVHLLSITAACTVC